MLAQRPFRTFWVWATRPGVPSSLWRTFTTAPCISTLLWRCVTPTNFVRKHLFPKKSLCQGRAPRSSQGGKQNPLFSPPPSVRSPLLQHSALSTRAPALFCAPLNFVGTLRRVLTLSERPREADGVQHTRAAVQTPRRQDSRVPLNCPPQPSGGARALYLVCLPPPLRFSSGIAARSPLLVLCGGARSGAEIKWFGIECFFKEYPTSCSKTNFFAHSLLLFRV